MMFSLPIALWMVNIILDSAGHVAFKFAARENSSSGEHAGWLRLMWQPWLWMGIVCFILEFLVWMAFLALMPLSQGVLLGSINIVVLMLIGRWIFGERLTRWRVTGMALIALGVGLVGLG